jgi:hypothetical protein
LTLPELSFLRLPFHLKNHSTARRALMAVFFFFGGLIFGIALGFVNLSLGE